MTQNNPENNNYDENIRYAHFKEELGMEFRRGLSRGMKVVRFGLPIIEIELGAMTLILGVGTASEFGQSQPVDGALLLGATAISGVLCYGGEKLRRHLKRNHIGELTYIPNENDWPNPPDSP